MITYKKENDLQYKAYSKEKCVGKLELLEPAEEEGEEKPPTLLNISVDPEHQKRGVGTKLLEKALETFPNLLVDNTPHCETGENDNGTHLATEGAKLVNSCLKKGILKKNNLKQYESEEEKSSPVDILKDTLPTEAIKHDEPPITALSTTTATASYSPLDNLVRIEEDEFDSSAKVADVKIVVTTPNQNTFPTLSISQHGIQGSSLSNTIAATAVVPSTSSSSSFFGSGTTTTTPAADSALQTPTLTSGGGSEL